MPKPAPTLQPKELANGKTREVIYFPSCICRTMGPAEGDPEQRPVFDTMLSVLGKAGYRVLFPSNLSELCCGMPFDSKGFTEPGEAKAKELQTELLARSDQGRIPVLCDTSPCVYRMRSVFDPRLSIYEPAEFIHRFLLDRLRFEPQQQPVALHLTCSSVKMGLADKMEAIARACAKNVVIPPGVGCCGFAGDKGFTHPELNASALSGLKSGLPSDCHAGYSNSRTCEIGLSLHAGIPYQSIVFLVDRCSRPLD